MAKVFGQPLDRELVELAGNGCPVPPIEHRANLEVGPFAFLALEECQAVTVRGQV